jgi:hypothetical protein
MTATEFAAIGAHSLDGYRSLARTTGLPVEAVARLAVAGELRGLFDAQTGRLLPAAEIRSMFSEGGSSPVDGGARPRLELLRLNAKRRAWSFP